MTHVLRARRLLTEEGWLDDHQLRIADGVIAAIEPIPVGVTERDAGSRDAGWSLYVMW